MIKRVLLLSAAALALLTNTTAGERICFDRDWRFSLNSNEGKSDEWRKLELPHDWSIELPFDKSSTNGSLPGGVGYYSKTFTPDSSFEGKEVEIIFDGVYRHATLSVNGERVGTQYDGYISFKYNITDYLKIGKENTIEMVVDNSQLPNSRWYSGSGIYRHVWLNVVAPLRVATWGTAVTTPIVTAEQAQVIITTTIENSGAAEEFTLTSTLKDSEGEVVAITQTNERVADKCSFDLRHYFDINNPKLWSPNDPHLYTIESVITQGEEMVDSYVSTCGIRKIEFDAKRGFFLNGENMKLKGVCLHHDGSTFGAAVPAEVWEYRLRRLKEIGCNAIRTAHNPMAPEFMALCDKYGIMVMVEFVDKWDVYFKEDWNWAPFADPYFRSEWQKNFSQTIRRDRNHPSVIMWSVGNETNNPGLELNDRLLDEYCSFVRTIDNTRPVISGMERYKDPAVGGEAQKIVDLISSAKYMDIMAMNYGEQWLDRMAKQGLSQPFVSTESYTYFNSTETKRHAAVERLPWLDVIKHDFNMGLFIWVGIDYRGEAKWPRIGSDSGIIDMNGECKESAELYRALWREDTPQLALATYVGDADDFKGLRSWAWPAVEQSWQRTKGDTVDLVSYTNCERVELYVNGKMVGTQLLAEIPNKIMKWRDVAYSDGVVKAIGYNGEQKVCQTEIVTPGKAAKLEIDNIETIGDYSFISISIKDSKSHRCYHAEAEIKTLLEGSGEIVSLSNANINDLREVTNRKSCGSYKGKIFCVVKGSGKFVAHAEGVKSASVVIK